MTAPLTLTTPLQVQSAVNSQSGWTQVLTFGQFDPSLGTLVDVRFSLVGDIISTASIENLGATAATIGLSLPGTVSLLSSGVLLDSVALDPTLIDTLGAFDGTTDYAGSSGIVFVLGQTIQASATLGAGSDFIGVGNVALTVSSSIGSNETGDANLRTLLQTDVGAVVALQYDYAPMVPPGAVGGGASGGSVDWTVSLDTSSLSSLWITTAPQAYTVPDSITGWNDTLAIRQFDPALGTLEAVSVTLAGHIIGSVAAENLAGAATNLAVTESATITANLPGSDTLSVNPSFTDGLALAAYDGATDFAGSSGRIDPGLTSEPVLPTVQSFRDPTLLAAFTGTGTYDLPITAVGSSGETGSANLLSELTQMAGAELTVSYTYLAPGAGATGDLACFAAGTRIATQAGPVAVEALAIDQTVLTQAGRVAPIVWIGHRQVDCVGHPHPETVWPVRVQAGAFASGQPVRDLFLSPDHAVAFAGVLIPVASLVNGDTVARVPRRSVTYWHVELDRHDVLLAEGLPVESFLDTGNRSAFANGGAAMQMHPSFASLRWEAAGCAPLVVTGPVLEAARAQLARRAAELRKAA